MVSLVHVMPEFLFASVYLKPETCGRQREATCIRKTGHAALLLLVRTTMQWLRPGGVGTNLAGLAADDTKQVRSLLVRATLVGGVAGGALCLEELSASGRFAIVRTRHDYELLRRSVRAGRGQAAHAQGSAQQSFKDPTRPRARRGARPDGEATTSVSVSKRKGRRASVIGVSDHIGSLLGSRGDRASQRQTST
jgi:hypothetical protein